MAKKIQFQDRQNLGGSHSRAMTELGLSIAAIFVGQFLGRIIYSCYAAVAGKLFFISSR